MADQQQLGQVQAWMAVDTDIRRVVTATCQEADVNGVRQLVDERPDLFDLMFDALADMVDEIPDVPGDPDVPFQQLGRAMMMEVGDE
jgi:hypothetical protein